MLVLSYVLAKRKCSPSVLDDLGDKTSPAALVGSTKTAAGIAVKELVEPEVVLPMLVKVEEIGVRIDGTTAFVVAGEEMLHAVLKLLGDLAQMHVITRACRTLDLEGITVEHVEAKQ